MPRKPGFEDVWGQPSAERDFQDMLSKLAYAAWASNRPVTSRQFLFKPDLLLICDEETLGQALAALYCHAREFASGLDIPFRVPNVRIAREIAEAGRFNIDEAGWLSIDISPEFKSVSKAMWVILAHEVCHHILNQSGLAEKYDKVRDERLTDAAMFICGFGEIVKLGQTFTQRMASGYQRTHLGYLRPTEYSFAYHWAIAARCANHLEGMEGVKVAYPSLSTEFRVTRKSETLLERLKCRVPDSAARERLLNYYRTKFPGASVEEIYSHVLDSCDRDGR